MLIPLIKKDLMIVKGYSLGVVAIAIGLPLLLAWRQPQMGGMISLLMAVLISSVAFKFSYIRKKKINIREQLLYFLQLPIQKGKWLFQNIHCTLLFIRSAVSRIWLKCKFIPELKLDNFAQAAALVFLIQAFGMGIFLPIQYKFGYEKTKFVCFLLFLSPVIIDITKRISFPSKLASLMQSNSAIAAAILCGCGIFIWLVSFVISKKNFCEERFDLEKV